VTTTRNVSLIRGRHNWRTITLLTFHSFTSLPPSLPLSLSLSLSLSRSLSLSLSLSLARARAIKACIVVPLKYARETRSREKIFSPPFARRTLVRPVCLERAKKQRGVSSPLSLRTVLVHKSRSRGRSVRAIPGGLKLLGREQSASRSNTQI